MAAYSYRIHALIMRTCIEIEANFKAILQENLFTLPSNGRLDIRHYRKIDASHHLSSYKVMLPVWDEVPLIIGPFAEWLRFRGQALPSGASPSLPWYQAYNDTKHDRHLQFEKANLDILLKAVAALVIVMSAQFRGEDFGAEGRGLAVSGYDYHEMEPATGGLFRIEYPGDWSETELYDFDWSVLREQRGPRFDKFDYDAIPI
ncbi:hypothetical protein [Sphingobium sp. CR28]|uniref:hypothetical protein n=1 Tax=Sphingobium sp. CR28 TaxID=3400272 RepID=UPI003FEF733A